MWGSSRIGKRLRCGSGSTRKAKRTFEQIRTIMAINKIVVLNLESQAKKLKSQNKTEEEIATALSRSSNTKITRSCVHRYFAAQVRMHQEVIEKNEKLKAKVVELELDTVRARQELIQKIKDLAEQAERDGDLKTALLGLDKAVNALDSLDKRLGRFTKDGAINVNIQINQQINDIVAIVLKHCNPDQVAAIRQELLACQQGSS